MRLAVVVLILLNILLFGVFRLGGAPERSDAARQPVIDSASPLVELPGPRYTDSRPMTEASAAPPGTEEWSDSCWRLGPFPDLTSSLAVQQQLWETGDGEWSVVQEQVRKKRYQVFIPVAGRTEAQGFSDRLRAAGLTDQQFLGSQAEGWFVSVGVFDEEQRALNLTANLADIGLPSEIRNNYALLPLHWLELETKFLSDPSPFRSRTIPNLAPSLRQTVCGTEAAPG